MLSLILVIASVSIPVPVTFASTVPPVTKVITSAPPSPNPVFVPNPIPVPFESFSFGASMNEVYNQRVAIALVSLLCLRHLLNHKHC